MDQCETASQRRATGGGGEARSGIDTNSIILYNTYEHLIKRTYEDPYTWAYITFKPFNDSYNPIRYQNCLDPIIDFLKPKSVLAILSREILASKIHVNALVLASNDLLLMLDGKNVNRRGLKYKMSVTHVMGFEHKSNVLKYIFKEADIREYKIYLDYCSYMKSGHNNTLGVILSKAGKPPDMNSDDPEEPVPILTKQLFPRLTLIGKF